MHNAIVKFNTDGTFRDSKRSGRPWKTTLRDDHAMKRIVTRSPMSSCNKIRAALRLKSTEISLSTVSRRQTASPEAMPDTCDEKKETGLCQTTSPLDCRAVEERVVLR